MKIVEFPPDVAFVLRFLNAGRSAGQFYEDQLPIYLAKVDRLPRGVSALIATADLQGRERFEEASQGPPRLPKRSASEIAEANFSVKPVRTPAALPPVAASDLEARLEAPRTGRQKRVVKIVTCRQSLWLRTALVCGTLPAIQELFQRFRFGLEQANFKRASLAAFSKLRDQMHSSWCDACEKAIQMNEPNEVRMIPLHHSLAGILDYMAFRAIGAQLPPEAHQAFAFLATERGTLETIPDNERASEIGHAIRWTFWKRKQSFIEESAPVLRHLN